MHAFFTILAWSFLWLSGKVMSSKIFSRALLHVWEQFMKPHIIIHQQILLMLKMHVRMEDLLAEHKSLWVLPEAAAREFRESARAMLLVYNAVARHFAESLVHADLEFFVMRFFYLKGLLYLVCRISVELFAWLNPPREGLQLFDVTSKLLQHITYYADVVSPRLVPPPVLAVSLPF